MNDFIPGSCKSINDCDSQSFPLGLAFEGYGVLYFTFTVYSTSALNSYTKALWIPQYIESPAIERDSFINFIFNV